MKIIIKCNCGSKDFKISNWGKYARCKKCGEEIYIKDCELNLDFEEIEGLTTEV